MEILVKARKVADYILSNWAIASHDAFTPAPVSMNMGAILVDAIFQAGMNYQTVVLPRVRAVASAFPDLRTVGDVDRAIRAKLFSSALNWSHHEKPSRLRASFVHVMSRL
jgi:hypothetical protein